MLRRTASTFLVLSALFSLAFVALLVGCGGSSKPLSVAIASPATKTIDPGNTVALSATVANDKNAAGVSWALSGSGCSGAACGALSGNTTSSVTYTAPSAPTAALSVTVTATSVALVGQTASIALTVPMVPMVTSTTLTAGSVGTAYGATLTESGGIAPYTWSVASGSLPAGVSLNASTGVLSGTPTASGSSNFTIMVKDSGSPALNASAPLSLTIVPAPVVQFATASLPAGTVGTAYSATVAATGGAGTLTYSITAGSLPAGLSLAAAGSISGTPTAAAHSNFTVTAADAFGDTGTASLSITTSYPALTITTASLPGAWVNVAYTQTLAASGGSNSGYTWTTTTGSLPAGLALSSAGAIAGKPTAAGTSSFTVQVTDSASNTATAQLAITATAITVGITSPSGSQTVLSGASAISIAATSNDPAGASTLNWTAAPTGCGSLSASSGAGISYTPPVTLASQCVTTITVASKSDPTSTASLGITVNPAPIVLTLTAPASTSPSVGVTATLAVAATLYNDAGSKGISSTLTPVSPAASCGSFNSMALINTAGATTTYGGTFTAPATECSATLELASVANASQTVTLTITVVPGISVTISPAGPVNMDANSPLQITPTVQNDSAGKGVNLTLTPATGCGSLSAATANSGTPVTFTPPSALSSACPVQVKATSQSDSTKSATLSITLNPALALPAANPSSLPAAVVQQDYSGSVTVSGGLNPYHFTVTGLSDGLTWGQAGSNGDTVAINGIAASAATITFQIAVQDANGQSAGPVTYTIQASDAPPLILPNPNPSSLPSAMVNQVYTGSITVGGGVGPTYTWAVNGLGISQAGLSVNIGNGLSASTTDNNILTVSGTPTSATPSGSPVSFSVAVTDSASHSAGPTTYTIIVGNSTQIGGQISLVGGCGQSSVSLPPITVSIDTSPAQTAFTDGNGNYSFLNVPNGTYTITPSVTGPSSVFFPANHTGVVISDTSLINEDFQVTLGYTITGSVSYSGTSTGITYVNLVSSSCGGNASVGTAISQAALSSDGSYTIRGAPLGSYTLQAWMDTVGDGTPNTSDPNGSSTISILSTGVSGNGTSLTLTNPSVAAPTTGPALQTVSPTDQGVAIFFSPVSTSDGNEEAAASYDLQWSTSSSFTGATTDNIRASGQKGVWILNNGIAGQTGSFTNATAYYFRARGRTAAGAGPWTVFGGSSPTTVTVGAPTAGNTVTGTVTIPATIVPTGPLYVGFLDMNANRLYTDRIASPSNSTPNAFTIHVPNGSSYFFFGILDQNNDGIIGPGDPNNTNNGGGPPVSISGPLSNQNLTLPSANSTVTVSTQYFQDTYMLNGTPGSNSWSNVSFEVDMGNKLPATVTLTSGPNVLQPLDLSNASCTGCGNPAFLYAAQLGAGTTPTVGDSYSFTITYSDGTSETLTSPVTAVFGAGQLATNLEPSVTSSGNTTPTFTWTYPANAANYIYQFSLSEALGGQLWMIPNDHHSDGFSSSQIPQPPGFIWGADPTNSGNTPSFSSLEIGSAYTWQVETRDSNGNAATAMMTYTP